MRGRCPSIFSSRYSEKVSVAGVELMRERVGGDEIREAIEGLDLYRDL